MDIHGLYGPPSYDQKRTSSGLLVTPSGTDRGPDVTWEELSVARYEWMCL